MDETNHFFNLGYGWLCKHCSAEDAENRQPYVGRARLYHEGGTEKKVTGLTPLALASWADAAHQSLTCPRCGIHELINKA